MSRGRKPDKGAMEKLIDEGFVASDIAKMFGVQYQTAWTWLKSYGLPIPARKVAKKVSDAFGYDEASPSCLVWKADTARRSRIGKPAGWKGHLGYYRLNWNGKVYFAHRIVWELHYGPVPDLMMVDHINRDASDNRIDNLRLATAVSNGHNKGIFQNNATGVKGLSRRPDGRWLGQVWLNGKRYSRSSKDRELIEEWLIEKRERLHGEYANHG